MKRAAAIVPPDELKAAHALLVSAAQLADNAARIRREATLAGDMARAWDASSAAAGALMLERQARTRHAGADASAATPVITPRQTRLVASPICTPSAEPIESLRALGASTPNRGPGRQPVVVPTRGRRRVSSAHASAETPAIRRGNARSVVRPPARAPGRSAAAADAFERDVMAQAAARAASRRRPAVPPAAGPRRRDRCASTICFGASRSRCSGSRS